MRCKSYFSRKNPKIISLVKEWNPSIHLIGFKLLVDVTKEHLIQIARESLEKNQADLIVANDLAQINENQTPRLIYVEEKDYQLATSKQEIADLINLRAFKNLIVRKENYGSYYTRCYRLYRFLQGC